MITAELSKKDMKRFDDALKKLVLLSDKDGKEILRQQGRLFAVDMARVTERRGKSASIGKKHKDSVTATIKSTYIHPLRASKLISTMLGAKDGNRFWNWMRRGEFSKAQEMVDRSSISTRYFKSAKVRVGAFDGGRLHKRQRFGKRKEVLIIQKVGERNKYIREKTKQVGLAKSGWAAAARDLGGDRGIPMFAKKGHPRVGRGTVTGRQSKMTLMVKNSVRYIEHTLNVADRSSVWRSRITKMEKTIAQTIKRRQSETKRRYKL